MLLHPLPNASTGQATALDRHSIGVVIIGRNEGKRLIACLESLDFARCHIVYVDSGSSDGSVLAATSRGAMAISLDMTAAFSAARARNAGFAALKADGRDFEFVQFIDGDCVLASAWLARACAFLTSQSDVAVVCGRRRERYPDVTVYNALCELEWNTPIGETNACGGDALMRALAFAAVNGYSSQLIAGEEPELCLRLREQGWKIWRLDEEMTLHDAAMNRFSQWWKRATRAGHAYAEVVWLHRNSKYAIWKINVVRSMLWGGLLPLCIVVGACANKFFLLLLGIYLIQIFRLAMRRGLTRRFSWIYAGLTTLSKSAEFFGMLRYLSSLVFRRKTILIEYK